MKKIVEEHGRVIIILIIIITILVLLGCFKGVETKNGKVEVKGDGISQVLGSNIAGAINNQSSKFNNNTSTTSQLLPGNEINKIIPNNIESIIFINSVIPESDNSDELSTDGEIVGWNNNNTYFISNKSQGNIKFPADSANMFANKKILNL